ncbi:hypothetical protein F5Y08DRAFT_355215, partial [Xylaria arbuscula]
LNQPRVYHIPLLHIDSASVIITRSRSPTLFIDSLRPINTMDLHTFKFIESGLDLAEWAGFVMPEPGRKEYLLEMRKRLSELPCGDVVTEHERRRMGRGYFGKVNRGRLLGTVPWFPQRPCPAALNSHDAVYRASFTYPLHMEIKEFEDRSETGDTRLPNPNRHLAPEWRRNCVQEIPVFKDAIKAPGDQKSTDQSTKESEEPKDHKDPERTEQSATQPPDQQLTDRAMEQLVVETIIEETTQALWRLQRSLLDKIPRDQHKWVDQHINNLAGGTAETILQLSKHADTVDTVNPPESNDGDDGDDGNGDDDGDGGSNDTLGRDNGLPEQAAIPTNTTDTKVTGMASPPMASQDGESMPTGSERDESKCQSALYKLMDSAANLRASLDLSPEEDHYLSLEESPEEGAPLREEDPRQGLMEAAHKLLECLDIDPEEKARLREDLNQTKVVSGGRLAKQRRADAAARADDLLAKIKLNRETRALVLASHLKMDFMKSNERESEHHKTPPVLSGTLETVGVSQQEDVDLREGVHENEGVGEPRKGEPETKSHHKTQNIATEGSQKSLSLSRAEEIHLQEPRYIEGPGTTDSERCEAVDSGSHMDNHEANLPDRRESLSSAPESSDRKLDSSNIPGARIEALGGEAAAGESPEDAAPKKEPPKVMPPIAKTSKKTKRKNTKRATPPDAETPKHGKSTDAASGAKVSDDKTPGKETPDIEVPRLKEPIKDVSHKTVHTKAPNTEVPKAKAPTVEVPRAPRGPGGDDWRVKTEHLTKVTETKQRKASNTKETRTSVDRQKSLDSARGGRTSSQSNLPQKIERDMHARSPCEESSSTAVGTAGRDVVQQVWTDINVLPDWSVGDWAEECGEQDLDATSKEEEVAAILSTMATAPHANQQQHKDAGDNKPTAEPNGQAEGQYTGKGKGIVRQRQEEAAFTYADASPKLDKAVKFVLAKAEDSKLDSKDEAKVATTEEQTTTPPEITPVVEVSQIQNGIVEGENAPTAEHNEPADEGEEPPSPLNPKAWPFTPRDHRIVIAVRDTREAARAAGLFITPKITTLLKN